MNITKYILVGTCTLLGFASCVNEEFPTAETRQGSMSLNVDKVAPIATRAVETADFPVAIYSQEEDREVYFYERADQVPNKLLLTVGKYYATAHTPGELEKKMDKPYYAGRDEFEILKNINTNATIECRMANGGITVDYTEEFKKMFENCDVSVDDGSQSAITYAASDEKGFAPTTHYLLFEENTKALYVNVTAITREEKFRSTVSFALVKSQAEERYDDDVEYFKGGDCIVIKCDTTNIETTDGSIVGISIKADIQFTETAEDVEITVEDILPEEDEEENPGGGDSDAITLTLPADMEVSATTDPALGNTYIAAEYGIKSIMVKMESTSAAMMGSLADLAVNYAGVDFATGAEVVGNQNMVKLFGDLGQTLAVPSEGDTEYTFPIGNFFSLLAFLPGEHTFTLTITDMEGNTRDGVLTLTVK